MAPDTRSSRHIESVMVDAPKMSNAMLGAINHLSDQIDKFNKDLKKFNTNLDSVKASNHQIQADIRNIKTELCQIKTQTSGTKARIEEVHAQQDKQTLSEMIRRQNSEKKESNRAQIFLNPEAVLLPLVDVKTGEEIKSFPHDLEAFYQLDVSEILHILHALDTDTEKVSIVILRETLRNTIM